MATSKGGSGQASDPQSREIDLDARRAARAEARGEPVTLRFGGDVFELPPELPLEYVELGRDNKLREAFAYLLGDQAEQFYSHNPSVNDIEDLASAINEMYGVGKGEAKASSSS